jgi:hypothetical protein
MFKIPLKMLKYMYIWCSCYMFRREQLHQNQCKEHKETLDTQLREWHTQWDTQLQKIQHLRTQR